MKIKRALSMLAVSTLAILVAVPMFAQAPPPTFSESQIDQLVARIALYPDPLLAQILAAATYPDQIPDAAKWADQHHYLTGQALADAIHCGSASLGSQRASAATIPVRAGDDGVRHELDDESWQCIPGATAGRDGRGPKGAQGGPGLRIPAQQCTDCCWSGTVHHDHAR